MFREEGSTFFSRQDPSQRNSTMKTDKSFKDDDEENRKSQMVG